MLALLDFDNVRKRMSVILRGPDNKVRLLCKGAGEITEILNTDIST